MKHSGRFVAYYRVSTARQGRSGLGLEAQQQAVREHLDGGNWTLVGEFVEVESGKRADRPKLAEAVKACRVRGAKLVIAKLDRLARNVAFISNLMESGVEFEAVDFPQANRLTIHIIAAMTEHEVKMISDRTKAALAAAKRRGVKLGGDRGARLTAQARAAGRASYKRARRSGPPILRRPSKSYRQPAVSHCGPLQKGLKIEAFRQRAAANGLPSRLLACLIGPASTALSKQQAWPSAFNEAVRRGDNSGTSPRLPPRRRAPDATVGRTVTLAKCAG